MHEGYGGAGALCFLETLDLGLAGGTASPPSLRTPSTRYSGYALSPHWQQSHHLFVNVALQVRLFQAPTLSRPPQRLTAVMCSPAAGEAEAAGAGLDDPVEPAAAPHLHTRHQTPPHRVISQPHHVASATGHERVKARQVLCDTAVVRVRICMLTPPGSWPPISKAVALASCCDRAAIPTIPLLTLCINHTTSTLTLLLTTTCMTHCLEVGPGLDLEGRGVGFVLRQGLPRVPPMPDGVEDHAQALDADVLL